MEPHRQFTDLNIGEFHKRLKIDPDLNFSKVNSRGVHSINLFACEKYFFEKFEFICFKHFRALPFLFGVEAHKSVTNWCPPYNVYYIQYILYSVYDIRYTTIRDCTFFLFIHADFYQRLIILAYVKIFFSLMFADMTKTQVLAWNLFKNHLAI